MQYLLDTHTLLWFLEDDPQLPEKVRKEIADIDNKCYVSIVSLWEIAIKIRLGKLSIKFHFEKFFMNRSTFIGRFKKAVNEVPKDYIQKVRLNLQKGAWREGVRRFMR